MALDSLTAKANAGIGTDQLAGVVTASGFAGAVALVDDTGALHNAANPVPVAAASLPLPTGAATEATMEAARVLLAAVAGSLYNHNASFTDGSPGQLILGKRRDADTTLVADGDLNTFNMDEEGRLKVASKPASYPDITGDITAIQATIGTPVAGGTVEGDVSRSSNLMVFCSGIFAGVNCTFEGSLEASGATNWFGIQAVRSNANTIELVTGALSAQPAYAWELSVNALKRFRVRATARTSGTQSWRFVQGTYATEPIPAAQASATQPVSGTLTSVTTVSAVTSSNTGIAGIIADVASAALTTTTTTAAFTPTFGSAYQINIPVTVATGTTPTLDVSVQESDDSGTNWFTVYSFPRITATGMYRSPVMPSTGNRIRYVQTVSGTTPSFTRAINRTQHSYAAKPFRQLIERTIVLDSGGSTTVAINAANCKNAQLVVACLGITTTAPAVRLQGSDDNGATWYTLAGPVTCVANDVVQVTAANANAGLIRGQVSSAGSGATLNYALIKGF